MLTHRNWIAEARGLEQRLDLTRTDAPIEFFLFLPLAHVIGAHHADLHTRRRWHADLLAARSGAPAR